jgi:pimeloyl-ACP methyl ester carboxylesterase
MGWTLPYATSNVPRFMTSKNLVLSFAAACAAFGCDRNQEPDVGGGEPDAAVGGMVDASTGGGADAAPGTPDAPGPGTPDAAPFVGDGVPGEFALTFNGRDYFMTVPSGYRSETAIPLIIGFHGACGEGAEFFDHDGIVPFRYGAEPANFILVIPATKGGCSDSSGFCADFILWPPSCDPNMTVPQITGEMDDLVAMIDEIGTHYRLDRHQIHAMGHSDGGLFSAVGGFWRDDVFASLTVFSMGWGTGYPLVAPSRPIPIQMICGGDDSPFCDNAQESQPWLAAQGHPSRLVVVPNEGHGLADLVEAMTVPDLWTCIRTHPLP